MSLQKSMNGNIPLAGKLEPVGRVPPVRVEVTVGETSEFGEGAENVFEDHEEDEEEGDHEGEEEEGDGFEHDEDAFEESEGDFEAEGRFGHLRI